MLHVNEYDDTGEVFGRPDQIELDIVIRNGMLIVCEIKSSVSRLDVHVFERKVRFYENRHQRTVTQKVIISPMVDPVRCRWCNHLTCASFTMPRM